MGRVAFAMVIDEVLVGKGVEQVAVADDREASRVGEEEFVKGIVEAGMIGIIEAHIDFATDDFFFFFEF